MAIVLLQNKRNFTTRH